jgi:hypothetical protein
MTLLLAMVMTMAAPASAQTKAPPANKANKGQAGKDAAPIVTTSTVVYRTKGTTEWSYFGSYSSEASARRVFEHLARTGYEAELRISNRPIPKLPPRKPDVRVLPVAQTVTYQKAVEVFKLMASQNDIAFRYPTDGCYARTQLMVERMQAKSLTPYKIWSVANGEELFAKTKNHPRGYVTWAYHVAPVLRVRNTDNSQRWYVIDPSLAAQPMTLSKWEQAQKRTPSSPRPYLTVTSVGKAPLWVDKKRKPGSGYWPGDDPKIQGVAPELVVHVHAVATMKRYKPLEGKAPPKAAALMPAENGPKWADGALVREARQAWHSLVGFRALR